MTTHTSNIVNGRATITIPEDAFEAGIYDVNTQYSQNDKYLSDDENSSLEYQTFTGTYNIDCTDVTQFYRGNSSDMTSEHPTLDDEGYVTTIGRFCICPMRIRKNTVISATMKGYSSSSNGIYLIMPNSYQTWVGQYTSTIEENKNGVAVTRQNTSSLDGEQTFNVIFTIDKNGYIRYQNSLGADYTSINNYTSAELKKFMFAWGDFNNRNFSIHSLKYEYNLPNEGNS